MENLNLTSEEIALIKEKRANDVESKKQDAINHAKNRINTAVLENRRLKNFYLSYFDMLRVESEKKDGVSFKLEIKEHKQYQEVYFYLESGRVVVDPIEYTIETFQIKYTGKSVGFREYFIDEDGNECFHHSNDYRPNLYTKDAEYSVEVKMHEARDSYRRTDKGFKMYVKGLSDDNKGQRMTNAKGVIKAILDDIEIKGHIVTSRELSRSIKAKAMSEAKTFFPNAKSISEYNRVITVTFENGVRLEMNYYTDDKSESGVKFVTSKVSAYGVDPIKLGNFLQEMGE